MSNLVLEGSCLGQGFPFKDVQGCLKDALNGFPIFIELTS